MMTRIILGFVLVATMAGCGNPKHSQTELTPVKLETVLSDQELAVQTLHEMLELAEKGDWGAYIDNHYGEQDRYESPSDRDKLLKRFEEKWGEGILPHLRRAAKLPVRIDGEMAVFMDGDEPAFFLQRASDGTWKFHL